MDWHSQTDEKLMVEYQGGQYGAFEELYRRHSGRVYGFLRKRLGRYPALVDDVFQGTFLKLHEARSNYDPSFAFAPWLFTVCRSVLIDAIRRKARAETALSMEDEAIENLAGAAQSAARLEAELQQEAAEGLSLETLPPTQREALEMRYLGELSFEQIAARLETSPGNARQLVSRALRALRMAQGR